MKTLTAAQNVCHSADINPQQTPFTPDGVKTTEPLLKIIILQSAVVTGESDAADTSLVLKTYGLN